VNIVESTITTQTNVPERTLLQERNKILDGFLFGIGLKKSRRFTGHIARYVREY